MLPPLFWPNEANRKDALLLGAPGVEPEGGPDGTDSRRVCRCRFVADACLVRGLCVGLPRDRTRLHRIRARLRHHRRQAFRVAAMRAPQPAACLHACVVPPRWVTGGFDVDNELDLHSLPAQAKRDALADLRPATQLTISSQRIRWQH